MLGGVEKPGAAGWIDRCGGALLALGGTEKAF
jgi:hypothetical protein